MSNTENKINPYIVTDTIAKSLLVDGLTTAMIFTIPVVAAITLPVAAATLVTAAIPILTVEGFSFIVGANIVSASATHFIRDYTRSYFKEIGLDNANGAIGGATKYGLRESLMQYSSKDGINSPGKILFKSALGAGNNYMYEKCGANPDCSKDFDSFTLKVEATESIVDATSNYAYQGFEKPSMLIEGAVIGVIVSGIVIFNINYVYIPLIESIHQASDETCELFTKATIAFDEFQNDVYKSITGAIMEN
jgi:hypothetical protein